MNSFREDHLLIHKFEDSRKLMIHFSVPVNNIIYTRNDDLNVIFKLYKDKYDNLDSIIENLFDATRPIVDYGEHEQCTGKRVSYKTAVYKFVELSCPTGICKEVRNTNCIIYQLSVYYPEDEDFVQVHIYAKRR